MAENDNIFVDGEGKIIQSSGTTVTSEFIDGEGTVVHEWVEGGTRPMPQRILCGPFRGPLGGPF